MKPKPPTYPAVTLRLTAEDLAQLDALVDDVYSQSNRHCVALAAVRLGLAILQDEPERLRDVLQDHFRIGRIKVRRP